MLAGQLLHLIVYYQVLLANGAHSIFTELHQDFFCDFRDGEICHDFLASRWHSWSPGFICQKLQPIDIKHVKILEQQTIGETVKLSNSRICISSKCKGKNLCIPECTVHPPRLGFRNVHYHHSQGLLITIRIYCKQGLRFLVCKKNDSSSKPMILDNESMDANVRNIYSRRRRKTEDTSGRISSRLLTSSCSRFAAPSPVSPLPVCCSADDSP